MIVGVSNHKEKPPEDKVVTMREKIYDDDYVQGAIQCIASVLSKRIAQPPRGKKEIISDL